MAQRFRRRSTTAVRRPARTISAQKLAAPSAAKDQDVIPLRLRHALVRVPTLCRQYPVSAGGIRTEMASALLLRVAHIAAIFAGGERAPRFPQIAADTEFREIARSGIALVPEGRKIFETLTVEDNMRLAHAADQSPSQRADKIGRLFRTFPILSSRRQQTAIRPPSMM
jgi:hypothetical protein